MLFALPSLSFLLAILTLASPTVSASKCQPSTISLSSDAIPGASITNIQAHEISNRKVAALVPYFEESSIDKTCEVVISYIYPGTNSSQIDVTVWLPEQWNERFLGTGGGAWMTTMGESSMSLPNKDGYATAITNGGLAGIPWAPLYTLLSPGNPNKPAVERLGYRAIHEMTVLAKLVIKSFYGKPAKTNIYSGCSTGGRQGLMEASRYPQDYDGIVAGAPAGRWSELVVGSLTGAAIMAQANYAPSPCELMAISEAALKSCDSLDGKVDGLVSRPDLCKYHASSAIGLEYSDDCPGGQGGTALVTAQGAKIMQQIMEGVYASDGEKITPGYPWGTAVWSRLSLGSTKIDEKTGQRFANPSPIAHQWTHDIVLGGLDPLDYSRLTIDDVQALIRKSKLEFEYAMEPSIDLRKFEKRGGKILTYHGLEDEIISIYNSLKKYTDVQEIMYPRYTLTESTEKMQDFWRLFVLPGSQHCAPYPGKAGVSSNDAYRHVTRWVEEGVAPERFQGYNDASSPYSNVCLWPSKPSWNNDQVECQTGVSAWDAMPSLSEVATLFIENLPSMLLLNPKPEILLPKSEL